MKPRPRVLLDCDGVLSDWLTPALAVVERCTGTRYVPEDFDQWNIFARFTTDGHDVDTLDQAIHEGVDLLDLAVLPGAAEAVAQLRSCAHVYIVTAASDVVRRAAWLERHFAVPSDRLVYAKRKYVVSGDVYVDDCEENVVQWHDEHGHGGRRGFLLAQPWNRTALRPRVGWDAVISTVRAMADV